MTDVLPGESTRLSLLAIARAAVRAHVYGTPSPAVPTPADETTAVAYSGVFVSLHLAGELRGCIGTLDGDPPLPESVISAAVAACSSDPRFTAVAASELAALDIEVSVLGPIEPVTDIGSIEVGRHGLIIEQGTHRGLLLPQVAAEWGWTREQFLAQTCRKAGLPEDAWTRGVTILKFEADVFGDDLRRGT